MVKDDLPDVHDFAVLGITYDKINTRLIFLLESETGKKSELSFVNVSNWELEPFLKQNILFEIQKLAGYSDLPSNSALAPLMKKEHSIYFLHSSIGIGGHILAQSVTIRELA